MGDLEPAENETPNSRVDKQTKYAMYIAFAPALIITGLIIVPLLSLFDHLELTGKLKLPDWVVWPAIFGAVGLFRLFWVILGGIIEKRLR